MNKPAWLKNSVAKTDGYYTATGEKLKGTRLTEEYIAEWNGAQVLTEVPVIAEEVAVITEEVEVNVEEAVTLMDSITSKFGSKKKNK